MPPDSTLEHANFDIPSDSPRTPAYFTHSPAPLPHFHCLSCRIPCLTPSTSALESPYCDAMLSSAYPIHGSANEVNCSGADAQVISCHCYPVVFDPFVEQLTVFRGLALQPAIMFYPLIPPSRWHHEWHMPKRYVNDA